MSFRTLTAANSVIILTVQNIGAHQLQGFSTDEVFATDDATIAEVMKGVDGRLSAGYVPFNTRQNYTLQADSESNDFFEEWIAGQKAANDVFFATNGVISLPSLTRTYTMTKGVLVSIPQTPSAGKTLKARKYTIEWDSVDPVPTL